MVKGVIRIRDKFHLENEDVEEDKDEGYVFKAGYIKACLSIVFSVAPLEAERSGTN